MDGKAALRRKRAPAVPVSEGVCAFCNSSDQDEVSLGKLYILENIIVHYYCALVSCGLAQKGDDEEGLFGFLYDDIQHELLRGKKLKCSYCSSKGATVGCCITSCKKRFHLPCGRKRGAVSMFYDNYRSYCVNHAPKQNVPEKIMEKALARQARAKSAAVTQDVASDDSEEAICAICYLEVDAWPSRCSFWSVCCAKDRWLHTDCLQRMALSAGVHYLKCPLCNNKDVFQKAAHGHGIYIPDRDAAWELEERAFAELYERPSSCSAETCLCVRGRDYDADDGVWQLKFCVICGSDGRHVACSKPLYVCSRCATVPPPDLEALVRIPLVSNAEPPEYRPLMTCRMSLRRTKPNVSAAARRDGFKLDRFVKITKEIDDKDSDTDDKSVNEFSPLPNTNYSSKSTIAPTDHYTDDTYSSLLSVGKKFSSNILQRYLENPIKKDSSITADPSELIATLIEEINLSSKNKHILNDLKINDGEFTDLVCKYTRRLQRPGPKCCKNKILGNIIQYIVRQLEEREDAATTSHNETNYIMKTLNSSKSESLDKSEHIINLGNISPAEENIDISKNSFNSSDSVVDIVSVSTELENESVGIVSGHHKTKEKVFNKENDQRTAEKKNSIANNDQIVFESDNISEEIEIISQKPSYGKNIDKKKNKTNKRWRSSNEFKKIVIKLKTPKISLKHMKNKKGILNKYENFEFIKSQYLSEIGGSTIKRNFNHKPGILKNSKVRLKTLVDCAIEEALKKRHNDHNDHVSVSNHTEEFAKSVSVNKSTIGLKTYKNKKKIEDMCLLQDTNVRNPKSTYKPQTMNPLMKLQKELNKVNETFDKSNEKINVDTNKISSNENPILRKLLNTNTNTDCILYDKIKNSLQKENASPKDATIFDEAIIPAICMSSVNSLINSNSEYIDKSLKHSQIEQRNGVIVAMKDAFHIPGIDYDQEEKQIETVNLENIGQGKYLILKERKSKIGSIKIPYDVCKEKIDHVKSIEVKDNVVYNADKYLIVKNMLEGNLGISNNKQWDSDTDGKKEQSGPNSTNKTPKKRCTKRKLDNLTDDQKTKWKECNIDQPEESINLSPSISVKPKRSRKNIDYSESNFMTKLDDTEAKDNTDKKSEKVLKQSVLNFSPENKTVKVKYNLCLKKNKRKKQESPDGLKQTTLNKFFFLQ